MSVQQAGNNRAGNLFDVILRIGGFHLLLFIVTFYLFIAKPLYILVTWTAYEASELDWYQLVE